MLPHTAGHDTIANFPESPAQKKLQDEHNFLESLDRYGLLNAGKQGEKSHRNTINRNTMER